MNDFQEMLYCIVLVVALGSAMGLQITLPRQILQPYQPNEYRQLPYQLVGIHARDSMVARLSGHSDTHPRIDIFIDAVGGPNREFQVFLYEAEFIEQYIIPSTRAVAASPCMDAGQSHGVAFFDNMTDYAWRLNAGALMVGPSTDYALFSVRDRIYPLHTGLYIVTMNACRYKNLTVKDSVTGAVRIERQLDVSGWESMNVNGKITVKNPYGYLPGQAYGYLPSYAVLLFVAVGVCFVYSVFCFRVGTSRLLSYQWVMLGLTIISVVAYLLVLSYYSALNDRDEDKYPLFVTGKVLIIIRNTVGVFALLLMCYGVGVAVRAARPLSMGLMIVGVVLRLVLNLVEFGLFESATNLSGTTGMWGISSAQRSNLGWRTARVFGMVVDGLFGALAAYFLFYTINHLGRVGWKRRLALYRRTAATLLVGLVVACLWALIVYKISDGPLGTFGEANWAYMWLPDMLYELMYFVTFSSLCMVWLPRTGDLVYLNSEELATKDGTGTLAVTPPPTSNQCSDEDPSGHSTSSSRKSGDDSEGNGRVITRRTASLRNSPLRHPPATTCSRESNDGIQEEMTVVTLHLPADRVPPPVMSNDKEKSY